jgi:hypothetical protein
MCADDFDEVVGEVGDVSDGLMFDFAVLAEGASQEVGVVDLALVAACGGGYVQCSRSLWHKVNISHFGCMSRVSPLFSGYICKSENPTKWLQIKYLSPKNGVARMKSSV